MEGIGKYLVEAMILMCIMAVIVFWGGWELIDWLFIDDAIKVTKPITPEIELIIKDNKVDTLYIYREP